MATKGPQESNPGGLEYLRCSKCGYTGLQCISCNEPFTVTSVNVKGMRNVSLSQNCIIFQHNQFSDYNTDSSSEEEKELSVLKRLLCGQFYTEKLNTLVAAQNVTFINFDNDNKVKINTVKDLRDLDKAPEGVFVVKTDWCSRGSSKEVLITQLDSKTQDFYNAVLTDIQDPAVPESVIKELYERFHLCLLGLTKSLKILMEPSDPTQKTDLPTEEVERVLKRMVPEEHRDNVTLEPWLPLSVQCQDDLDRQSTIPMNIRGVPLTKDEVTGALKYACRYGNPLTLKKLLTRPNADVDHRTTDGLAPIHIVCKYHHHPLLAILKDAGADIHAVDFHGWFPLHYACFFLDETEKYAGTDKEGLLLRDRKSRQIRTVQWLLDQGSNINQTTPEGQTALDLAKSSGSHQKVLDLLV